MKIIRSHGLALLSALWILGVGIGMKVLSDYQNAPGQNALSQIDWPLQNRVSRARSTPTLVMLAHPQCPCTRASLSELARLMARCPGQLAVRVLFLKPREMSESWLQSDLWKTAAAIPGVQAMRDENGALAKRFGAKTSGQVLLYDAAGKLVFSGGITGARGHEGDNDGSDAIADFINTGRAPRRSTPVFGCAVFAPAPQVSGNRNPAS